MSVIAASRRTEFPDLELHSSRLPSVRCSVRYRRPDKSILGSKWGYDTMLVLMVALPVMIFLIFGVFPFYIRARN